MAKDFSYLFYPGDVLRQIQFFSQAQKGCYLDVLTCHIENIRISYQFLMKITRDLNETERSEFLQIFEQDDGGYYIHWVVESIKKRAAFIQSRGDNRRGTDEKNEKHKKIISNSYQVDMENENKIEKKEEKKKDIVIPEISEFLAHAKTLCDKAKINFPDYSFSIESKYQAWVADGWKDGHGEKIKVWKTKLANTLPHLKPIKQLETKSTWV